MATRKKKATGPWSAVFPSRDEQFQLKRMALLREAARAFSANGYHNTSLDDVAASLGVTKAALYYYVKSKQEILFECHMLALDLGDQALDYARAHGKNAHDKITLFCQRYIELITGEMGSFAVLAEFNALESKRREIVLRRRDDFEEVFKAIVREGIEERSIREVDPKLACFFFMGAVNWMTRWFRPDGDLPGETIAAEFTSMFSEGIRQSR
ncbi:MAG: TetR family transcriptional regulator [Ectothiorhodospiraceae bacterium]|nr:TetR family transcriptional regulator [Ectothiorhodospiraceae bacterium]